MRPQFDPKPLDQRASGAVTDNTFDRDNLKAPDQGCRRAQALNEVRLDACIM